MPAEGFGVGLNLHLQRHAPFEHFDVDVAHPARDPFAPSELESEPLGGRTVQLLLHLVHLDVGPLPRVVELGELGETRVLDHRAHTHAVTRVHDATQLRDVLLDETDGVPVGRDLGLKGTALRGIVADLGVVRGRGAVKTG